MLNTTSILNNQYHEVNRSIGIDTANLPLCPKHCQELLEKRALDERWIQANCRSLTAQEATQRLGYPAKSGGILLEGVGIQIQFKPDRPWKNEGEKRAPKYRSPLGDYDAMLPIHPDDKAYWDDLEALKAKCYQVEGHPCLVISEGFFKAIAGCSNGIPTIGLLGVEMGLTSSKADIQGKRYLVEQLEKFARAEFGFIIAFDADAVTNKAVILAQLKLAQQLLRFKVPVYSATGNWSIEQGKGMDDYIQNHGADQFKREILGKALAPDEWVKIVSKLETDLASDQKPAKSRYMQRKNAIRALWGHRLRLNTLKQQVELDGEPLDIDFVRADLCEALDIDIPKEEAIEMVLTLAGVNRYCPITEYLRHVEQTYSDPNINLDTLASQLLNTSNPLHAVYLKRHLIGSVARALHPGCKMDTALILQGNQGILKSTFFNILYGDGFFDDTMTEAGDKDEIMKLHQHWAVEWAEFETTLSRRGYSRLKAFMTTKVDNFRPPYGRTVKSCLRHSVLVGSTNEPEFLNDPSGDRRFWVIPTKQINIELTKSLRDQIWAAAVQAYKKGEPWYLNEQEKQWADEANRPFRVSDTWEDFISNYIQGKQFVTIAEVLSHGLDLEPAKQDKSSQMRATAILRRWGWAKGKRWAMNSWQRGWFAPDDRSTDPPLNEVDRGVDRSEKPNEIKGSSYTDPPDPPFTSTLSEITTSTQHQLTPTPGEGGNDVKENSGKSWEKGGSVIEVDRSESDVKSRVTTTDPPSDPPTDPPVDYSTFPHLTSDTIEAKRNQAEKIKRQLLEATNCEVLSALRQEFSTRLEWTWKYLLTDAERNKITAVAQTLQLNLLAPGAEVPAQVAQSLATAAEELAQPDENEQLKGWNQCHFATAYICPTDASVEECQTRSLELRSAYRAAKSKADLSALKIDNGGKFTKREHIWVQNWLKHFFPDELVHVNRLAKG